VSDTTATFAVQLKDEVSQSAKTAADSLVALEKKLADGQKQLGAMEAAMRKLKAGGKGASDAAKDLKDKIAAQKAALASTQEAYVKLGGTFVRSAGAAQQAAGGLGGLLGQAQALPGPLGAVGGRLAGLAGPAGLAAGATMAVAGAMLALVSAAAAATAALLRYGIAQSNARRSELLRLDGLRMLPQLYGRARASGLEMQAALDRASDSSALGRDELGHYGDQLSRLGIRGEALATSLEAVGMAATVAGERGAAFARRTLVAAARSGRSLDEAAETLRARFGPAAQRMMLDWDVQTRRLRQSLDRLFSGLRIEQFLEGVRSVFSIFSQTTVTGRALKAVVESLFQPLIDFAAGPVMLAVRRFFQGMVLGALMVESGVLQLRVALRDAFGPGSIFEGIDGEMVAFRAGTAVLLGLVGAVVLAGVAFGVLGLAIGASLALMAAPLIIAVAAVVGLVAGVRAAYARLIAIDWGALGRAVVDGILGGLRAGIARLTSTVTGMATSIRETFANALQIRSPSRIFADLGEQIPAGLTLGIEAGTPDVGGAVADMVSVPSGLGGGGGGVSVGDIHVHVGPGVDGQSIAEEIRDAIARVLEGAALEMGAPA
jgi:hypothetical protein